MLAVKLPNGIAHDVVFLKLKSGEEQISTAKEEGDNGPVHGILDSVGKALCKLIEDDRAGH